MKNCRISVAFSTLPTFLMLFNLNFFPFCFSADDVCHPNSNSSKKKSQALAESKKLAAGLAGLSGLCAPSAAFSGGKSVFCTLPLQSTLLLSSGAGQETSKWPSIHFTAQQQSRTRTTIIRHHDFGSYLHLHGTIWHYYSRVRIYDTF